MHEYFVHSNYDIEISIENYVILKIYGFSFGHFVFLCYPLLSYKNMVFFCWFHGFKTSLKRILNTLCRIYNNVNKPGNHYNYPDLYSLWQICQICDKFISFLSGELNLDLYWKAGTSIFCIWRRRYFLVRIMPTHLNYMYIKQYIGQVLRGILKLFFSGLSNSLINKELNA